MRRSYFRAFDWSGSPATVLGAVENGHSLAHTLALLQSRQAEVARSAHITISTVTFTDARHATVRYSLTFSKPGSGNAVQGEQAAVKIGGQWLVGEQGYCAVVKLTGVACPG